MLRREVAEKIASALGSSVDEICHSEQFEQAVYDMAKTKANLSDMDCSNNAQYNLCYGCMLDRIKITYK